MKKFIIAIVLSIPVCRAFVVFEPPQRLSPPVTYSCDDTLAPIALKAFTTWDLACGGYLQPTRVDASASPQVVITETASPPSWLSQYLGFCAWNGTTAAIQIVIPDTDWMAPTMLHEIGHALGLGHTTDSLAIMQPVITGQCYLDQDDIDGVRFIYVPSAPPLAFSVALKHRRAKFAAPAALAGPVLWQFGDGTPTRLTAKPVFHTFRKGTLTVSMTWGALLLQRTVTVQK